MPMPYDFRLPQFSGSDKEQLEQIKSYLFQFAEHLSWYLNAIQREQDEKKGESKNG